MSAHNAGDAWDVVVVGAGPSGALAALLSARSGARTMLIERARFPRHKVCGCCLAPRGQRVLEDVGCGDVLDGMPMRERMELRVGGRVQAIRVPGYRMIDRETLDTRLVELGRRAGVEVRLGTKAWLDPDRPGVVELVGDGGDERVTARACVVADGLAGSSLRGWSAFEWIVSHETHVGVGGVLPSDAVRAAGDRITMCVGAGGYTGLARLACGRWSVAAALSPGVVREHGMHAAMAAHVGGLAGRGWDDAGDCFVGVPGLTRRRRHCEAAGRVFVVGDAGGYVEPFTGEGMSWGLEGAARVARHVQDAARGRYEAGAWTRERRRFVGRSTVGCRVVSGLLRRERLLKGVVGVMGAWPSGGALAAKLVAGRV